MTRDLMRLAILCGAIAFAVMFGMELSSNGISNVYGPMESPAAETVQPDDRAAQEPSATPSAETGRYGSEPEGISLDDAEGAEIPRLDHEPAIDRIASSTAEMLQSVSKGGIHLIAKLFSSTTE